MPEFESGPKEPENFEELFRELERNLPQKMQTGARGARYGTELFSFKKPSEEDIKDAAEGIVLVLQDNEDLPAEKAAEEMAKLGERDRHLVEEAAAAQRVRHVLEGELENAERRAADVPAEDKREGRLGLTDDEVAVQKFSHCFGMLAGFFEGLVRKTEDERLKNFFAEYAEELTEVPQNIHDSYSHADSAEDEEENDGQ